MKIKQWSKTIVVILGVVAALSNANLLSAAESEETLWDSCDSITVTAPGYGSRMMWNPKEFKQCQIGTTSVDTKEKVEGKGSIHWVVTEKDIQEYLKKAPRGIVAIHKLYGKDWSPYVELKFSIKCKDPNHPDILGQLLGSYTKPPVIEILKRGEVTNGWKEISWDLTKYELVAGRYGKIMNHFRIYTNPSWYKEILPIDLYIDNIRLVTRKTGEIGESVVAQGEIASRGYIVFPSNYMDRGTSRTVPSEEVIGKDLELFATPGEYEPVSFCVRAAGNDLKNVTVTLADNLRSKSGAVISKDRVDIRVVKSMKRWLSPVKYVSMECYLVKEEKCDIPKSKTQRYWLTVHVPEDAGPGIYQSRVQITPEGEKSEEIGIKLEVLPFKLANLEGMNNFMYYNSAYLPDSLRTQAYQKKIFEDMKRHGMTTTTLYLYPDNDTLTETRRGCLGIIPTMTTLEEAGLVKEGTPVVWLGPTCYGEHSWKLVLDERKKRNWPEMLFYVMDEPNTEGEYKAVVQFMKGLDKFRDKYPNCKVRTITAIGKEGIKVVGKYYDIWICSAEHIDDEMIEKAKKMGKELWSYAGFAPVDAQSERYYFGLWAWKTGVKGCAHWAYLVDFSFANRFGATGTWGDVGKNWLEWTNRYSFVYPTDEELIPTIGWEGVREGTDDYRYLKTLFLAIQEAKKRKVDINAIGKAENLLKKIERKVHAENLGKMQIEAQSKRKDGMYFDRTSAEPELNPAEYNKLRYQVAQQIINLQTASAAVLAVDGEAVASIVVSDSAILPEQTAAKELADYLGKITGGTFVVTTETQAPELKTRIYVGQTSYAKDCGLDLDTFGPEQWVMRTVGKNLVLAGGRPRGTLYAVYHFLEDVVGVHWWSPWEEYVPSRPNLRITALDRHGEPVFWMRALDTLNLFGKDTRFAARNRINRDYGAEIPFEYGGENDFGPPYFIHTEGKYFNILRESFKKHPEWVALKNGERKIFSEQEFYKNQLCLSNQELRRQFLAILKENIRKTRNQPAPPMIFDVSLNDTPSICECDACQAIVKKYGGFDSGLLLDFVNYMADGIKEEYPGVFIETAAYLKTEDIPRGIVPRSNVIITLCDTKSSYTAPISEDGYFAKRLQDWSRITDKIFVWDYHTPFTDPATPLPFEYTFQPDLKLFRKYNVIGVFTDGLHNPVFEEMRDLRLWLLAKLYEDPYQDQDALIKTFTDGFYGPAGVYIRQYIDELEKSAKANPCYANMNVKTESCKYLTPSFILKAQKYFGEAEKAAAGSGILLRRVRHARLAIDKATLALFPKIWNWWQADGKKPEDLPLDREQIAARLRDTVETQWKLRDDIYDWWRDREIANKKRFLEKIDGYLDRRLIITRPPAKFAHLPENAYRVYPADSYGIYQPQTKVVEDKEAESGITNRTELTEQLLDELDNNALKWDMHDYTKRFTGKEATIKCLKIEDIPGPGYHWYKLGTYSIGKDNFLWIYGAGLEVKLNDAYDPVDTTAKYDIWAQIKFEGPAFPYGTAEDKNAICISHVVVIKSPEK